MRAEQPEQPGPPAARAPGTTQENTVSRIGHGRPAPRNPSRPGPGQFPRRPGGPASRGWPPAAATVTKRQRGDRRVAADQRPRAELGVGGHPGPSRAAGGRAVVGGPRPARAAAASIKGTRAVSSRTRPGQVVPGWSPPRRRPGSPGSSGRTWPASRGVCPAPAATRAGRVSAAQAAPDPGVQAVREPASAGTKARTQQVWRAALPPASFRAGRVEAGAQVQIEAGRRGKRGAGPGNPSGWPGADLPTPGGPEDDRKSRARRRAAPILGPGRPVEAGPGDAGEGSWAGAAGRWRRRPAQPRDSWKSSPAGTCQAERGWRRSRTVLARGAGRSGRSRCRAGYAARTRGPGGRSLLCESQPETMAGARIPRNGPRFVPHLSIAIQNRR